MFFEVSSLTYHSPITTESLTYSVEIPQQVTRGQPKEISVEVRETRGQHAGHASGVLDVLRGHPLFGILLQLAPRGVVLQRADAAAGSGCVQAHVGALESIGGVVEVSEGQWNPALEERNAGPHQ